MRLLRSKRGIGTIVASVMFLMISVLFIGGTFLWQSTNEAHMNAFEKDRMDESLSVEASYYYNEENATYTMQLKVKNTGPIDIEVNQAWIIDTDYNEHKSVPCYYIIPVDSFEFIAEIDDLNRSLSHQIVFTSNVYFFKVVTERGNTASSRLMPKAAFISNWPAVIVPEASWVKKPPGEGQIKGEINLVVYNKLEDDIHIDLIVASQLGSGSEHSELIYVDWILEAGAQDERLFFGYDANVYQPPQIVFIELADSDGIVVSSYYFKCQ